MKSIFWIVALIIIGIGLYALSTFITKPNQLNTMASTTPQIIPITHASGILKWGETSMYFDPTGGASAFAGQPQANIVLVTDVHGDHLSTSTLLGVVGSSTTLIVPQAVKDMLPPELASRAKVLANDQNMVEQGFSITAVPMYNLPGESENFHTKGRGNGYIVERDNMRVYIAGDTAGTPEMRALRNITIALIPMNLPYTMSVEEAADAVLEFKPKTVYPYHYRGPDGLSDVQKFKDLVNTGDPAIEVVLGTWYTQ